MSDDLIISGWWNPCFHCPPLLSGEEWEIIDQNQVFYTNYMWGDIPVGVQAGRTVKLHYNFNQELDLFWNLPPVKAGPVGCTSFAWPMQSTGWYGPSSVNYYGGASLGVTMHPMTIPYGLLNNGIGDGFYDQTGLVYSLRPDLGYPVGANCMAATIDLSFSYLGVEIFATTLTFSYSGFKYAIPGDPAGRPIPVSWGEMGVAVYLLSSVDMVPRKLSSGVISPAADTPFEVSPAVMQARGWLYRHVLDGPYAQYRPWFADPPIDPDSGNYMMNGFVYDGPLDRDQDIIFTVRAVGSSAPSYPPPARFYAALEDFESNVAQPPVIDTQFIMGQALYGSFGDPVPVYDYQWFGF